MFRSCRDLVRTPVKTSMKPVKKYKYYCDLCTVDREERVWDSETDIEIHRRTAHKMELMHLMKNPGNYVCTMCLRQQLNKDCLIAHIKTDHLLSAPDASRVKREIFICDYCNNIFFNKLLLTAHIKFYHYKENHKRQTTTATCPICYKSLKMKQMWFHFANHGVIHTGTCPICLKSFDEYQDVIKHTESHPGFYYCNICGYNTDREGIFVSHLDKHRKLVDLEDKYVEMVKRFFIPQKRVTRWNKRVVNFYKGITMCADIHICVMCRALCETEEEMLLHIYGDHSPTNTIDAKRYLCTCGEEFFNNVLLKHHIFKLKGDHKVFDANDLVFNVNKDPIPKMEVRDSHEKALMDVVDCDENALMATVDCDENTLISELDCDAKALMEAIYSKKNFANSITNQNEFNNDTDDTPNTITISSQDETQECTTDYCTDYVDPEAPEIKMEPQSMQSQNENIQASKSMPSENAMYIEIEISEHLQHEIKKQRLKQINMQLSDKIENNAPLAINIQSDDNDIQMINDIQSNHNDIQSNDVTMNEINTEEIKRGKTRIINSIYNNQVTFKPEGYILELPNNSTKFGSNSVTIQLVKENMPNKPKSYSQRKKTQHKRIQDENSSNKIVLNNKLAKKFVSPKQFYEQITDELNDSCDGSSLQYEYAVNSSQEAIQCVNESARNVYEIVKIPYVHDEDSEKVIIDGPLLFN